MLSKICLPGMKADWFLQMQQCNTLLSLFARILAMTLYMVVHRLMGLKCCKDMGFYTLGMRVIIV